MRAWLAGVVAAFALALPAAAQPPVWIVRDADSEMVLFGSVHVLPPGLNWRPKALDAALQQADDLWFELAPGPATEQEVARLAGAEGVLPTGQSLYRLLSPKDAQRLMRVADAFHVDRLTLDRLEPWLAEVAIVSAAYGRAGANVDNGVEKAVEAAAAAGVRREALETPAQQISFFAATSLSDQVASLRSALDELETDPDGYLDLVKAWMAGDTAALDREELEPMRKASPEIFRRLVTARNAAWARQLDARLKGKGRTVVVVGVGHLVGEGGLPARLRALGYSVTGP